METKPKVLYIDAFNLFYQMFSIFEANDSNGDPIGGVMGFVTQLQRLVAKFSPQKVVVVFDGPEAGKRRRSFYKDYKGKRNRKVRTSMTRMGDEKVPADDDQRQLKMLYEFLKMLPVEVLVVPYFEADDVIAYLVKKNPEHTNIISSSDRDYLQLVNENTFVWSPQKKILYTPAIIAAEYEIIVQNITYMRALVGDTSDKLVGVKGIGKETLFKILPQLQTDPYASFDEFWNQVELLEDGKGKTIKSLKENRVQAELMYKLMVLDYTCLNQRAIETLQGQDTDQQTKAFSKLNLKLYCIKQHLEPYVKNYEVWVRPFIFLKQDLKLTI